MYKTIVCPDCKGAGKRIYFINPNAADPNNYLETCKKCDGKKLIKIEIENTKDLNKYPLY